nr:unnamed protein product [Callosobruchus analis]
MPYIALVHQRMQLWSLNIFSMSSRRRLFLM